MFAQTVSQKERKVWVAEDNKNNTHHNGLCQACINTVCPLLCRYYGLWMWFPELFKRIEDGGSPCANVSRSLTQDNHSCYPVQTAGRSSKQHNPSEQLTNPNNRTSQNKRQLTQTLSQFWSCCCLAYLAHLFALNIIRRFVSTGGELNILLL